MKFFVFIHIFRIIRLSQSHHHPICMNKKLITSLLLTLFVTASSLLAHDKKHKKTKTDSEPKMVTPADVVAPADSLSTSDSLPTADQAPPVDLLPSTLPSSGDTSAVTKEPTPAVINTPISITPIATLVPQPPDIAIAEPISVQPSIPVNAAPALPAIVSTTPFLTSDPDGRWKLMSQINSAGEAHRGVDVEITSLDYNNELTLPQLLIALNDQSVYFCIYHVSQYSCMDLSNNSSSWMSAPKTCAVNDYFEIMSSDQHDASIVNASQNPYDHTISITPLTPGTTTLDFSYTKTVPAHLDNSKWTWIPEQTVTTIVHVPVTIVADDAAAVQRVPST